MDLPTNSLMNYERLGHLPFCHLVKFCGSVFRQRILCWAWSCLAGLHFSLTGTKQTCFFSSFFFVSELPGSASPWCTSASSARRFSGTETRTLCSAIGDLLKVWQKQSHMVLTWKHGETTPVHESNWIALLKVFLTSINSCTVFQSLFSFNSISNLSKFISHFCRDASVGWALNLESGEPVRPNPGSLHCKIEELFKECSKSNIWRSFKEPLELVEFGPSWKILEEPGNLLYNFWNIELL